jgi:hypothetical protein
MPGRRKHPAELRGRACFRVPAADGSLGSDDLLGIGVHPLPERNTSGPHVRDQPHPKLEGTILDGQIRSARGDPPAGRIAQ